MAAGSMALPMPRGVALRQRVRERVSERERPSALEKESDEGEAPQGLRERFANFFSSARKSFFARQAAYFIGANFLSFAAAGLFTLGAQGAAKSLHERSLKLHLARLVDSAASVEGTDRDALEERDARVQAAAKFLNDLHGGNKLPEGNLLSLKQRDSAFKRAFYESLASTDNIYLLGHLHMLKDAAKSERHHSFNVFSLISRATPSSSDNLQELLKYMPEWPAAGKLRVRRAGKEFEVDLREVARRTWTQLDGLSGSLGSSGAAFDEHLESLSAGLKGADKQWAAGILKRRAELREMSEKRKPGQGFNPGDGFKISGAET